MAYTDHDLLALLEGDGDTAEGGASVFEPTCVRCRQSTSAELRLEGLVKIARVVNSILDIDQILDVVMDELLMLVGAERGFVALVNAASQAVEFRVARNLDRRTLEQPTFAVSRSIVREVFAPRRPLYSMNAARDRRFATTPSVQLFGLRGVLAVPLLVKADTIGVIYLDSSLRHGSFVESDLEFVSLFANQVAMAIDSARLDQERRRVHELFEGYVSRELLDDILTRTDLNLAGQVCDCTVMFCDIRGFTGLSEQLSATSLVARLNEFYREMGEIIFRHGGILFTYLGDAIMAVFGAPVARSDDASRAIKAALDMCKRLGELQLTWCAQGTPVFEMGIGLCTGEVVAGDVGFARKREYTVIGDAVNTAARLEKLNKGLGSRIVMSDSTRAAAGAGFPLERLGSVKVRGKSLPMDLWTVCGFGAGAGERGVGCGSRAFDAEQC